MRYFIFEQLTKLALCFVLILLAPQALLGMDADKVYEVNGNDRQMALRLTDAYEGPFANEERMAQIVFSPPPPLPPFPPHFPPNDDLLKIRDLLGPSIPSYRDLLPLDSIRLPWPLPTLTITNKKLDDLAYSLTLNDVSMIRDLAVCILSFLEARDLGRMSSVSKILRKVIGKEPRLKSIVWDHLIEKSRGDALIPQSHEKVPLLRFIRVRFGDYDTDAFNPIYEQAKARLAANLNTTITGGYTMGTETKPMSLLYSLKEFELTLKFDVTQLYVTNFQSRLDVSSLIASLPIVPYTFEPSALDLTQTVLVPIQPDEQIDGSVDLGLHGKDGE